MITVGIKVDVSNAIRLKNEFIKLFGEPTRWKDVKGDYPVAYGRSYEWDLANITVKAFHYYEDSYISQSMQSIFFRNETLFRITYTSQSQIGGGL